MMMSARTARRFFGNGNPIGRTLPLGVPAANGQTEVTLVGVVGDVKYVGIEAPAAHAIYLPYAQSPIDSAFLVVRTVGDPLAAVPTLRREIAAIDPDVAT